MKEPDLTPQESVIGGCKVHHVDVGREDAEAVVLLHGITATHRFYRHNIAYLARRRRVIAPDLPGFGGSGKPDVSYSTDYFVAVLAELLDAKGIERAHLVGNSMGGQIAMQFALAHPARVDRLVLVAPAGVTAVPMGLLRFGLGGAAFTERHTPRVPAAAIRLLFHGIIFPDRPDLAARYVRGYLAGLASQEGPLHFRTFYRALRGVLATPLRVRAREIGAPTLILWGARDRLLPVTAAPNLRRRIAHSRLLIYRESGHCPMVDQPDRWNHDVERFLDGEIIGR